MEEKQREVGKRITKSGSKSKSRLFNYIGGGNTQATLKNDESKLIKYSKVQDDF